MALIDSKASFKARVIELGLGEHWEQFETHGFLTYVSFTCSPNYTPAAPDEKPFIDHVVTPLVGADVTKRPITRGLFFESYALMTSDMKRKVEKQMNTALAR